jgi:hypothetical protein
LQQVFGEPSQHLLLKHQFIHDQVRHLEQAGSDIDYQGLHQVEPPLGLRGSQREAGGRRL